MIESLVELDYAYSLQWMKLDIYNQVWVRYLSLLI